MTTISSAERRGTTIIVQEHPRERFDTVVIGGGQAGLAAGYHLAENGVRFVILDARERVGDAWRNRWDSLTLFTPARFNSLPGMPFPGPPWAFPKKDDIADYLEQYAATMHLPVRNSVEVRKVSRTKGGWCVDTGDQQLEADAVIIATGGFQTPKVPAWASELDPNIMQLHSADYRNPSQFLPGPVLVVGASHSGADIALEASRDHRTMLAGRDTGQIPFSTDGKLSRRIFGPLIWFAVNHVITVNTPMGRKARKNLRNHGFPLEHPNRSDLARAGVERITARATGVRDGKPMLDDGTVLEVPNVVWCTGFRGDYSWVDGVTYGEDGYPEQERGVVTTAPGLYFLGLKFQYAGASSLVGGVGRDAAHIADHIAASIRQHAVV